MISSVKLSFLMILISSTSSFISPRPVLMRSTRILSEPLGDEPTLLDLRSTKKKEPEEAAVNTINERLMAEIQESTEKEKFGPRSAKFKKLGFGGRNTRSTEEIMASIEEARNLNGVNPVVALVGGSFGLLMAAGLWFITQNLGTFFALHPVNTDVYFIQRVTGVFRNVVMGLSSLASGFFGVTGFGIFCLGIRVAYGVANGELDPTPIKRRPGDEIEIPNIWNLMTGKKPDRRGGRNNDDNPFGL